MKKLCLLHANCQGEEYASLLLSHPGFAEEYDVKLAVNYTGEPVDGEDVQCASLFLYQFMGDSWGKIASSYLLKQVTAECRTLCIPNMTCKLFWPFWSSKKYHDLGDLVIDDLVERGLSEAEITFLVLKGKLFELPEVDLKGRLDAWYELERKREHETPVKYLDLIMDCFRSEFLFYTINHPGEKLMRHGVQGILSRMGFDPVELPETALSKYYTAFEFPIHPYLLDHHNATFVTAETRYNIYGTPMDYDTFVRLYIRSRCEGYSDFVEYLGALSAQDGKRDGSDSVEIIRPACRR